MRIRKSRQPEGWLSGIPSIQPVLKVFIAALHYRDMGC